MAGGVHRAGDAHRAPVRPGRAPASGRGVPVRADGRATTDQLLDDRRACRRTRCGRRHETRMPTAGVLANGWRSLRRSSCSCGLRADGGCRCASLLVTAISWPPCRTVGVVLRWFESITRHVEKRPLTRRYAGRGPLLWGLSAPRLVKPGARCPGLVAQGCDLRGCQCRMVKARAVQRWNPG